MGIEQELYDEYPDRDQPTEIVGPMPKTKTIQIVVSGPNIYKLLDNGDIYSRNEYAPTDKHPAGKWSKMTEEHIDEETQVFF